MTKVKMCGITQWEDAGYAAELGADALGFVFYAKSPRYVQPVLASEIIRKLPPFIATVGVFVDNSVSEIEQIAGECNLSTVQLHGRESPDFCEQIARGPFKVIKAFRVEGSLLPPQITHYQVDAILLDTYQAGLPGGTGKVFSWQVAQEAKAYGKIILAGGLNADNIEKAIETVRPYAVDVSSGIEVRPGVKSRQQMAQFMKKVKGLSL